MWCVSTFDQFCGGQESGIGVNHHRRGDDDESSVGRAERGNERQRRKGDRLQEHTEQTKLTCRNNPAHSAKAREERETGASMGM